MKNYLKEFIENLQWTSLFNKETNNLVLLDKSFNDFFNKTPVVVEDNHMVSQPLLLSFNGVKYDFPI